MNRLILALRIFSFFSILYFLPAKSFSQSDSIVLYFGGDCTFAVHFDDQVHDNFNYPFQKLEWFTKADISMVNLENPISNRGIKIPKTFNFRMNPKYLAVLKYGGIDIVTCANNHSYDYGKDALFDTMRYLDSIGVKHVGIGKGLDEARKPVIFNINNKKIGFLGYHGKGGWYPATSKSPGVIPIYEKYIREDIDNLKKNEKVDYIIVNFHWGKEGSHYPDESQIKLGHFTIDAGADLIIGHHPHVLQGIEKYKKGIIVYSLGNFIFGGNSRREYDTMIFKLVILNGNLFSSIIPIHVSSWQPYRAEGKLAQKITEDIKEYSKKFIMTIF